MPPKRRPKTVSVPTADKVAASVRNGDFAAAVEQARQLLTLTPSDAHTLLFWKTVLQKADHHESRGELAEVRQTLALLHQDGVGIPLIELDDTQRCWERWANLVAMSGDGEGAHKLNPEPINRLHFADYLVRTRTEAAVPPEWKAWYDAIVTAFRHYTAGKDEPAREALNAVGLGSPFLEWKLLLRGLIAWTANDDAKAVENFSRLNAERYPARLAAPVRAECDKAFAPDERATLTAQARTLRNVGPVGKLAKVRTELARGKKLTPSFKAAEAAVSDLKKFAPALLPKLADCFYFAIIRRGEQDDLARHRKLFGPPPADPQFHKLEALVFEEIGQEEVALERWVAYEKWLASEVSGWPKPQADRARAVVLRRCAGLAQDIELAGDDGPDLDFFFAPPKAKGKKKAPPPDPVAFLKRAVELAPDWEQPASELFAAALDHDDPATAEAAARNYLTHNPKSLGTLSSLAKLLASQGHTAEALDLRRRALAVNPLDTANRHAAAAGTIAHARRLGMTKPAEAEKLLAAAEELLQSCVPTSLHALRSVLLRKLKRPDDADRAAEVAASGPSARLVARLYLHANAVILKLKPAEKKAAADALAALLEQPTPGEAATLWAGYEMYYAEGQTYTGQKAQEKKLLDVLVRAVQSPAGLEAEFELVAGLLGNAKNTLAAAKAAAALMKRFPKNPFFPLVAAKAEFARSKGRGGYKVTEPLRKAKALAEASTEERHKQLLPQIDELLKAADPLAGMFGSFFG